MQNTEILNLNFDSNIYNLKIVCSGNVFEVYEYEKYQERGYKRSYSPFTKDSNEHYWEDSSFLDSKEYDINSIYVDDDIGIEVPQDDFYNELKERISARRRAEKIRRLINANRYALTTFLTLTFKENLTDLDIANKEFDKFSKRMNRYLLKNFNERFKYVAVIEFQQRGAIHYHLLCNLPTSFKVQNHTSRKSKKQKEFEVFISEKLWKNGFCDCRSIDGVDNVGAYLWSYMIKDSCDKRLKGRKAYLYSSTTLEKEVILYLNTNGINEKEKSQVLALLGIHENDNIYKKIFNYNDYTGFTTYKEYNKDRK